MKKSNHLGFSNVKGIMVKRYDERGDYEQFRNEKVVKFKCLLCGNEKTSKLVVIYKGDWQKIICNGCYGKVLDNK
jgi:transcription elongation factor Elf1